MNAKALALIGLFIALVGGTLTFPLWQPYFVDDVVNEAFPEFTSEQLGEVRDMPQAQQDILVEMAENNAQMASDTALAMLEDDTEMNDNMPADEPFVLFEGVFGFIDAVHNGEGSATIYELPDDSQIVRLENFRVTNGPQLHVILSPNAPDTIFGDVGDYVDLGALSGNIGNQNYTIPDDINIEDYQSVIIYCVPFNVIFSVAPLDIPAHSSEG